MCENCVAKPLVDLKNGGLNMGEGREQIKKRRLNKTNKVT